MPPSPAQAPPADLVRGAIVSLDDQSVVLALPGTQYRLTLALDDSARGLTRDLVGKRVRGRIEARALRMFRTAAGGRFIEPIEGVPRIVQGMVMAIDSPRRRLLVDAVAPMWVTVHEGQSPEEFAPGELVNFYVESGTRFVPMG